MMPTEYWEPKLCTHAYFRVGIRPKDYYWKGDDPLVGSGDIRSVDPIRAQDRFCRIHGGGAFQIAEHGGAVPTHCVAQVAAASATQEGFGFIDKLTGGYRILSATQSPEVYEARWGSLPTGAPI